MIKEYKLRKYDSEHNDVNDFTIQATMDGLSFYRPSGLLDKNEKEYFEGDILDNKEVVAFREGCFYAGTTPLALISAQCEIIGAVYQNPELIESK